MIVLGVLLTLFVTVPIVVVTSAVIEDKKRKVRRCCWTCYHYDYDPLTSGFACMRAGSEHIGLYMKPSDSCDKWEALK